jgi:RNA polymerase sigma-70 factor (ECF subfamily)
MAIQLPETLAHLVNDRHAFERTLKQLYHLAFCMVHNHQDAEDIVQESLMHALQSAHTFAGRCQLTTWLCQIVRNQARNLLHRRSRFPQAALEDHTASPNTLSLEALFNDRIDGGDVFACLSKLLSPVETEVIQCHYVHGWSCAEIATLFAKTPAAIRQLHSRALCKLRSYFMAKPKTQKLENLLAEYADALLAGKAVDKEQLFSNYDGDREELAELLAIIEALDRVRPRPRKEFVERMRELIKQHRTR